MRRLILTRPNSNDETDFVFSLKDKKGMAQLEWDGDDEFSLNGEMYDVLEKKVENNTLIIRALADKKETTLLRKANDNWKENEKSNKIANELFQLLQTLYHHSKSDELTFNEATQYNFNLPLESLPLQVKKIPTPPPQPGVSNFNSF
ncbi:MAG TPA: hypothetical protein VK588_05000 [Chitinophagaceae bacterium]|nr:hypothetical protein [Chitinophagaceae bacterium]